MKTISIAFDTERFLDSAGNKSLFEHGGYATFFSSIFKNGLVAKDKEGNVAIGRGLVVERILRKLFDMQKDAGYILEVEEAEYDVLKSVFLDDNTKFHVSQISLAVIYRENIEKAETCKVNGLIKGESHELER